MKITYDLEKNEWFENKKSSEGVSYDYLRGGWSHVFFWMGEHHRSKVFLTEQEAKDNHIETLQWIAEAEEVEV